MNVDAAAYESGTAASAGTEHAPTGQESDCVAHCDTDNNTYRTIIGATDATAAIATATSMHHSAATRSNTHHQHHGTVLARDVAPTRCVQQ
jgi:hypothetical protein